MRAGDVVWLDHHVARLARDAARLGLPPVDPRVARRALVELARAAFPSADGIVRLEHARGADGRGHWLGVARSLGVDASTWRAVAAPVAHEGWHAWSGAKRSAQRAVSIARAAAARAGADEAILVDAAGRVVEGARAAIFVHLPDGVFATPALERGGVRSLAREVALARARGAVRTRDVSLRALRAAREVVAVNAVRGARPLVELDGEPLGAARGPLLDRLREWLDLPAPEGPRDRS